KTEAGEVTDDVLRNANVEVVSNLNEPEGLDEVSTDLPQEVAGTGTDPSEMDLADIVETEAAITTTPAVDRVAPLVDTETRIEEIQATLEQS
ncbi:hypothetical protein Dimus_001183, partial [Dionaea muscipula]